MDDLGASRTVEREFVPAMSEQEREERRRGCKRAVERSMHWGERHEP